MQPKRILIVSEMFSMGGLETHVAGMVRVLNDHGCEVHLAVGCGVDLEHTPPGLASVVDGLSMGPASTAADVMRTVRELHRLIEIHRIELVHAQPFLSFLPATLAAALASVPLVLTLHGPGSLRWNYGPLHDLLLRRLVLPAAARLFCVSPEVHALVRPWGDERLAVLPNAVNIEQFAPVEPAQIGRRWAVVSRLDAAKCAGIRDFCVKALATGINAIDIVGDGPSRAELHQWVVDSRLSEQVKLLGARLDVAALLTSGYEGAAGMGRAVLEAAAMNLPTVLVGYDGVRGLLNLEKITNAAWWNFSGRGLPTIPSDELDRQLNIDLAANPQAFQLRPFVTAHHDDRRIWEEYLAQIQALDLRPHSRAAAAYDLLKTCAGDPDPYLSNPQLLDDVMDALCGADAALLRSLSAGRNRQQAAELTALTSQLRLEVAGLTENERLLREQIKAAEMELAGTREQLNATDTELATTRQQLNATDTELAATRQQFNAADTELAATREQLNAADAELAATREQLDAANARRGEAQDQLTVEVKQRQTLEESLQAARHRLNDIEFTSRLVLAMVQDFRVSKVFRVAKFVRYSHQALSRDWLRGLPIYLVNLLRRLTRGTPLHVEDPLVPLGDSATLVYEATRCLRAQIAAPMNNAFQPDALDVSAMRDAAGCSTGSPGHGSWSAVVTKRARPVITIVNMLFYDRDGVKYMFGGAERYIVELSHVARELGLEVEVVQSGSNDWEITHHGPYGPLRVIGIKSHASVEQMALAFRQRYPNPGLITIYSPFTLAFGQGHDNAIGISHGVYWDHESYLSVPERAEMWRQMLLASMRCCQVMVSVDANTINWVRATAPKMPSRFVHIPNFVNLDEFTCGPLHDRDQIVVLYPRRLYAARGFHIATRLAEHVAANYPNVIFRFIGDADEPEAAVARSLVSRFPGRVFWETKAPGDMHQVYQDADISLVPTTHSEGTSLSCLEAMASGNVVIASNVGGLPELVTDGFNGRLLNPDFDEFKQALDELIVDASLRKRMSRNAVDSALAYSLDHWRDKWRRVLIAATDRGSKHRGPAKLVHLAAPGMRWHRMKQRPQQLCQALAARGVPTIYVSDEDEAPDGIEAAGRANLEIVARTHPICVRDACIYTCFAMAPLHNHNLALLMSQGVHSILFDILDDPKIQCDVGSHAPSAVYQRYFDELLRCATYVIASSRALYEKYRSVRPDIKLVSNAASRSDWQVEAPIEPPDLPLNRPIIGYYGALAEWTDLELIARTAARYPDCNVVLIGPLSDGLRGTLKTMIRAHRNLLHLGLKKYDELKHYLHHFTVATMPFLVNDVTHAVSPIKLFEYAAARKPIVSTAIGEVRQYAEDGVLVGESHEHYLDQMQIALDLEHDEPYLDRLEHLAAANSWANRARDIAELIGCGETACADQTRELPRLNGAINDDAAAIA